MVRSLAFDFPNMTRTDSLKAHQARAVRKSALKTQVVTVDPHWRIVRFDEFNWQIQYKGEFKGYYSHLLDALKALPTKMLDTQAQGTLEQVLELNRTLQARIETALKMKLA